MANDLATLARRFRHQIDLVLVYIREAHAGDEWPIGQLGGVEIPQHTSVEARKAAAEHLLERHPLDQAGFTVCLDTLDDAVDSLLPSWPTKVWCVQHGRIAFKARRRRLGFDNRRIMEVLPQLLDSSTS